MNVTCEINDYSTPAMPPIRVHDVSWNHCDMVELEIDGKRYTVDADELISAVQKAKLGTFNK